MNTLVGPSCPPCTVCMLQHRPSQGGGALVWCMIRCGFTNMARCGLTNMARSISNINQMEQAIDKTCGQLFSTCVFNAAIAKHKNA